MANRLHCPIFSVLEGGILKDKRAIMAMHLVDRGHFSQRNPYMDSPQSIGYRVTISAPHMVSVPCHGAAPSRVKFFAFACFLWCSLLTAL